MADVSDYALLTSVEPTPMNITQYARYTRAHAKGNSRLQRLKRRHQAAGTWTDELAAAIANKYSEPLQPASRAVEQR